MTRPKIVQQTIYFANFFTRAVKRETLRAAVFLWIKPFWAVRASFGSAAFNAAAAFTASPDVMASSTLRTSVRMAERRVLLMAVRLTVRRAAFCADLVLASKVSRECDGGRPAGPARRGDDDVGWLAGVDTRPATFADEQTRRARVSATPYTGGRSAGQLRAVARAG